MYKYLTNTWRKPTKEVEKIQKDRLIQWRKENTITKAERPTRIDKARRLGYKAKPGFVIVRAKVSKGGRSKARPNKGRKPKRMGVLKITAAKSHQWIAEGRVARVFKNLEVLNSYLVGDDSVHVWYEVILVDPLNPSILSDKNLKWITQNKHKRRVYRGLTSAAKKK